MAAIYVSVHQSTDFHHITEPIEAENLKGFESPQY